MAPLAPLVGRDELLAHAAALLEGGSRGIVLVGVGGVGKSRLAAEIVQLGMERSYHAVSTVGTQAAAAIPLGALSHLLPDLGSTTGTMLAAARSALVRDAGGRPLLLSVDDAHLLDDYSATLILQLAMAMPSFVVATVRSGHAVPDAITSLWKEGLAERIEVERLDDASIERLAAQVLGGPLDPGLASLIGDRARGNALVARELCLAGRDEGSIRLVDGRWSLVGTLGVPALIAEVVAARIADLGPEERRAIDLLAQGEPIGWRLAEQLVDPPALLELERRGLVTLRDDGRRREIWLSHPMYAEALRSMAGGMLTASIKAQLAAATTATGMRRRTDLLRVATWQLEAGAGDPDLLRRAAGETYRAADMVGTSRLAAGAWDLRPTADTGLLLATALAYSGSYAEADAIFSAASALATDDATRTRIAVVHAAILSAGMGQPAAAIQLLADAEVHVAGAAERAMLRGQRAHLLALDGRPRPALDLVEPLLADYADGPVLVTAAMAGAIALELEGAYEAVVALVDRALPETRRLWDAGEVSIPPEMLELERYGARVSMGILEEPPDVAGASAREGSRLLNRPIAVLAALHAATTLMHRGRPRSAARAIEAVGPVAADLLGAPASALLSVCAALTGDVAVAGAALAHAESWRRSGSVHDPFVDGARIWTRLAEGQPALARRLAAEALEAALAAGRWGQALGLAHTLARIGGIDAASAAAARIGDRVHGQFAALRLAHISALATDDRAGLEAAADGFAAIGAELLAAETGMEAARAARRAGEARRATALARTAVARAARCEGARTPSIVAPEDELTPLSRRELEVAELAARGLSSEAIADRLFLSVRTVDNHLGHVYQKLGITSRAELAGALGRDG